jgi:hypothetical protein
MVEQPIPFYQWRPGSFKNSTRDQTGLKAAAFAVKEFSTCKVPGISVPTLGTYKSSWPPLLSKMLFASFIVWERFLKRYQTILLIFLGHIITCPRIMSQYLLGVKCIGIY